MTLYACGGRHVCVFVVVESLEKVSVAFLLIQYGVTVSLSDAMGLRNVLVLAGR